MNRANIRQRSSTFKDQLHDNTKCQHANQPQEQHRPSSRQSTSSATSRVEPIYRPTLHMSITSFALLSRVLVIAIQIISNHLIPDHDAEAFIAPREPNTPPGKLDGAVGFILGGLHRWDAQYILHISEHGYTYENTLAFFPLFPFVIKTITIALGGATTLLSYRELSLLLAVFFNVVCFVFAAKALYKLSNMVLGNKRKSELAVILFCFNPASIFFTAPYSECLYSWLSFTVMAQCIEDINSMVITIPLSLSILCRSNGTYSNLEM